jgi:hypothetical protein
MGDVIAALYRIVAPNAPCVKTRILSLFFRRWAKYHKIIQRFLQETDVSYVRSRDHDCARQAVAFDENTAFCPHFFPDPWDFSLQIRAREELLSCNHPCSAIPNPVP